MQSYLITLVIVVVIIGFLYLNVLYKRTNSYKSQFSDAVKFSELSQASVFDIVNLGSNHPRFGLDFSEIYNVKAMNWALGPQTFEYDYVILKAYSKHLHANSKVLIPICPLKFFLLKKTNEYNLTKYYCCLKPSEIPDFNLSYYIKEHILPLLFHPKQIRRVFKDTPPFIDEKFTTAHQPMNNEELENDASWWIEKCWNREFDIDIQNMQTPSENNKKSIETNIKILGDIIKYCIANDFEPIIIFLPVTSTLRKFLPNSFINDYIYMFVKKAIGNQKVRIFNYLDDIEFQKNDLYLNSFFMNLVGRKLFTKRVVNDISVKNI